MEIVRLRVQYIDFDLYAIQVWQGKGGKNRRVTLAKELCESLKAQIAMVHSINAHWHYLFPSGRLSSDPETGYVRRHHIDGTSLRKARKIAAYHAEIEKTSLAIYATHLLHTYCNVALILEPSKNS